MEITRLTQHPLFRPGVLYALWLGFFFVLFFKSWVCEDAYITFRVIDNFVNGYGLRWNIHERVQVYTHPLWLLLHLPFALMFENLYFINMALSLVCSSAAVAIVLLTFRQSPAVVAVFFMLPLFVSKCFVDYAGSGLETSLSYLLFSMLGYVLIRWQEQRYYVLALSFVTSLLLLNRLDHITLIAPMLLVIAWKDEARIFSPRGIGAMLLGALPLFAWFSFALLYYGFLFPNTKYAKLDTGLEFSDYLAQGVQYAFTWLNQDTASVLVTIAAIVMGFRRSALHKALSVGIILNLVYTVYIGGDYMMGRFFAFTFFAAAWLLLACMPQRVRLDIVFTSLLMLAVATTASYYVRNIRALCEGCIPIVGRIMDATYTFGGNKLFTDLWPPRIRVEGQYKFAYDGKKLALEDPAPVKPLRFIGMQGYHAGSRAVLIDEHGLADALLARLPAVGGRHFYIGHFRREVPEGYINAIQTGDTSEMDSGLGAYYEKLKVITQDDLFSKERFSTIYHFNMGHYDRYRSAYLGKKPE